MTQELVEKEMDGDTVRVLFDKEALMSFTLTVNGNTVARSNRPDELIDELERRYGEGDYKDWFQGTPPFKEFDTFDLV